MDLTRQIDAYCERTGPDLWSEPLNAITNAAFILAGLALLRLIARGERDAGATWLAAVILLIGVGSFLFHTFATAWAAMLDTGPIALFILSWFAVAMGRFAGLGLVGQLLSVLGLGVAMVAVGWALGPLLGPLLGSSTAYVPPLIGLAAVALWLALRDRPGDRAAAGTLALAAAVFTVSLAFRVADQPLCDDWPVGTHFGWHVLNATVLYLAVLALIRYRPPRGG